MNQNYNPSNIDKILPENKSVADKNLKKQTTSYDEAHKKQDINERQDLQTMRKIWSWILSLYLIVFTITLFVTLWCKCAELDKTTLNILIIFGFAKVLGVVWVLVNHLFPVKK